MAWPILDILPEDEARSVLAAARRRRFARNEVVFHEGDPGDTLHLVDKGRAAVRVTTPLGERALLRIVGPGEHFGELAVVAPGPRSATVVAVEDLTTLSLHKDAVDELRRQHGGVDRLLLEAAMADIRRLTNHLLDALYVPVPKRLARRVLDVADRFSGAGDVDIPLTQEDVAGLSGTSRPTANKVLKALEDKGVLEVKRGGITLLDIEALRRAAR